MLFVLQKMFVGLLIGIMVGWTGIGAGVLSLPILIFGFGISPIMAVGSDAVFNALTKLGAGIVHWRQGTVNWRLFWFLSFGGIPGALFGVLLLAHIRSLHGNGVNSFVRIFLGVLLVVIPLLLLTQRWFGRFFVPGRPRGENSSGKTIAVGLFSGFLAGVSSVGSGSVAMPFLLALTPSALPVLVGTNLIQAAFISALAGGLQLHFGNVDMGLVIPLLLGSIPGSMIGARLSCQLPGHWLKRVLCVILLVSGARMLLA